MAQPPSKPTDAEGNEVAIDLNWKKFLSKEGNHVKKGHQLTKKENKFAEKKSETKAKVSEKKETLLRSEETEIRGVKKIPLLKKRKK